jgi:hypothetical protein
MAHIVRFEETGTGTGGLFMVFRACIETTWYTWAYMFQGVDWIGALLGLSVYAAICKIISELMLKVWSGKRDTYFHNEL